MLNKRGQAIVMLILIMTVALAIGLSVVQKSLVDVSTSSKVEQSSRAFSAAEAGVDKALQENAGNNNYPLGNNSFSNSKRALLPAIPPFGKQDALELSGLSKQDIGQVWLADFTSNANPPTAQYNSTNLSQGLDLYWGDANAKLNTDGTKDYAALDLTLVYWGDD